VSWQVETSGDKGWLWVSLYVHGLQALHEGQKGHTFLKSGTVQLPYPVSRINFNGGIGDFDTPGYHGWGPRFEGYLEPNQTSASVESSD
jgi:hypothetical protein